MNIFAQYLQPVRSITDRMADLDAQDFRREQLSGARQQNAIQALAMRRQMEAEESGRQQQAKFANYLQQSGGDVNVLQRLLSADASMFERAQGLAKELGERDKTVAQTQQAKSAARKSEVDADKERLSMIKQKSDMTLQLLSAAKDPRSYSQVRQWIEANGGDVSTIPPQFDPEYIASTGRMAMTVKERADQEWKAKGYDLDVRKQGETERDNRARVAASYANAAAVRETANATRDAAKITARATDETKIRQEFADLPEVKKYKQAAPSYEAIVRASKTNNPQADINLIYGLAKLYDPESVVREGEYATIANSQAIPEWLKGQAQRLVGGGKLTEATKKQIVEQAKIRFDTYKGDVDAARTSYEGIVGRRGLSPENVFPTIGGGITAAKPAGKEPTVSNW